MIGLLLIHTHVLTKCKLDEITIAPAESSMTFALTLLMHHSVSVVKTVVKLRKASWQSSRKTHIACYWHDNQSKQLLHFKRAPEGFHHSTCPQVLP